MKGNSNSYAQKKIVKCQTRSVLTTAFDYRYPVVRHIQCVLYIICIVNSECILANLYCFIHSIRFSSISRHLKGKTRLSLREKSCMSKVERCEQRQNKPIEMFVVFLLVHGQGHSIQIQKHTTFMNVT